MDFLVFLLAPLSICAAPPLQAKTTVSYSKRWEIASQPEMRNQRISPWQVSTGSVLLSPSNLVAVHAHIKESFPSHQATLPPKLFYSNSQPRLYILSSHISSSTFDDPLAIENQNHIANVLSGVDLNCNTRVSNHAFPSPPPSSLPSHISIPPSYHSPPFPPCSEDIGFQDFFNHDNAAPITPINISDLISICHEQGQQVGCCVLPVLGPESHHIHDFSVRQRSFHLA